MRQRNLLLIILIVLLIILGVLIYLYITLMQPTTIKAPSVEGVDHQFTIYGFSSKDIIKKPHGVAVDKKGNIYITDSDNGRVLVFNRRGRPLSKIGKKGSGTGELTFPLGITVAPNGDIYVCDKVQSKIVVYDSKGKLKKEIKEMMPLSPTIYKERLYVATYSHIVTYDLKGNLITKWGTRGRNEGQFDFPGGVAVDRKGNVYVSDSNNTRVQALDRNGEAIWIVGRPPRTLSERKRKFGLPDGMAIDDKQRLYVIDAFRGTIHIFTDKGKKLAEIGEMGKEESQLYYPSDIAYAGGNRFVIADKYNNRVQVVKLSIPEKKEKK